MSQAYTPGLEVSEHTTISKLRELPLEGEALVEVGQKVNAETLVLKAELPGQLDIIRVAERMGLDPIDVVGGMKVKKGDTVGKGDLLNETKTFFNLFTSELLSPSEGEIEFFLEANAHLGIRRAPIPLVVNAYVNGEVEEVDPGKSVTIKTQGALIQGIFGVGGERQGEIYSLPFDNDKTITAEDLAKLDSNLKNKILIGGARFDSSALEHAQKEEVSAVVTGAIDAENLAIFVGHEIGVSITGDEDVPFTLIITEGFGDLKISKRVTTLAKQLDGKSSSVNGATQVRAGAMRPEVITPIEPKDDSSISKQLGKVLKIGSKVRLIRVPYFGQFGEVTELPSKRIEIPSGAKVRVAKIRLDSGNTAVVPRANLELI